MSPISLFSNRKAFKLEMSNKFHGTDKVDISIRDPISRMEIPSIDLLKVNPMDGS